MAKSDVAKERFFNLPVIVLISLSFMLGMSEFIVVGVLPDIAAGLKVSEVTVGNLVSLFAFVYAPVTPLGSALSARFPRFATHLTLVGVFLIGNVLCAFASNYGVLVVARILIALVSGTLVAIAMTYAPDVTTEQYRTEFIAWVFSGFSIASVVGVPVGTWVANTFGWRWAFHLVNVLTVVLIVLMVVVLPRNSRIVKIGFLPQFRLFFDRRIQLGVLAVVFGAAATYVFYTYLTPIMRDEVHVPEQYLSVGLVIFGAACLWSNLYGGKLADRGRGVEPLTHIRPIYCAHAVLMASLIVTHWVPVYGALLLVVLGMFMYLQNSASQVLYMDVASQSHPGSLNLAASLNSMSFNIGIAATAAIARNRPKANGPGGAPPMTERDGNPPGLMISAPSSGTGKTTVMLGLLRALAEDGLAVQPFKSGPDYIDPAFHQAACGRASYNLDSWAMDQGLFGSIAAMARGADICVAEGSMGLFDGVATRGRIGFGASAETARAMGWPVVLVLDVSGQAQSAAATALGFARYDPDLPIAGVILNRVASPRHLRLTQEGMTRAGLRVLGALPRRGDLTLPERHLGLIQAVEHPDLDAAIAGYAAFLREHVDLAAIRDAATGHPLPGAGHLPPPPAQRIALAQDAAFSFTYPHILKGWRDAGAQILPFSPLADEAPDPSADLVWLPGGYPELHTGALSAASHFMQGLRRFAKTGPVHGECGGYMVLGQSLTDKNGQRHQMAGLLGLATSYEKRRLHLGYRRALLQAPLPGHGTGDRLRGHEFHYSTILDQPDQPLAHVSDADGTAVAETGSRRGRVTGTFFHLIAAEH